MNKLLATLPILILLLSVSTAYGSHCDNCTHYMKVKVLEKHPAWSVKIYVKQPDLPITNYTLHVMVQYSGMYAETQYYAENFELDFSKQRFYTIGIVGIGTDVVAKVKLTYEKTNDQVPQCTSGCV